MPLQITTNKPGQVRPISIYKPAQEGLSRWVMEWAAHLGGLLPGFGGRGTWGGWGGTVSYRTLRLQNTFRMSKKKGGGLFTAHKGRVREIKDLLVTL